MTPGQSFRSCLTRYATFSGRASRSEFWWFQAPWLVVWAGLLFSLVIMVPSINRNGHLTGEAVTFYPFFVAFYLASAVGIVAVIIPSFAVTLRRLHDTGRSGWWVLIVLVPFGVLVLLVFLALEGTPGQTRFGPAPLTPGLA